MKKLANFKSLSESGSGTGKSKKSPAPKNNPYPASGRIAQNQPGSRSVGGNTSVNTPPSGISYSEASPAVSRNSLRASRDDHHYTNGSKSTAPTISTKADTTHSDAAQSKAGTVNTNGGAISSHGLDGEGSTFSSPAPSVRSLTTTLTTIQSAAPGTLMTSTANQATNSGTSPHTNVQFTHQFPTSPPASAIPSHVTGGHATSGGHPNTYTTATANNLLSDNASVLTLASSSKRRRRNSLDTNASVRALAPSSVFGGSRESLPLSVLSTAVGESSGLHAVHNRPSVGGMPAAERASVYSSSGVAPALTSERNSYYATKQANAADGASIRSGLMVQSGHARNDSITGSIGGPSSPLASPRETPAPGTLSRRSSGWGDGEKDDARDGKHT
jgi:hypothetical protein